MGKWIGVVGVCLLSLVVGGCLILDPPDFPDPEGLRAGGSCMCAICWDRPFCLDANGEVLETDDPESCPAPFNRRKSVPASRATELFERETGLWCIQPDLGNVNASDVFCPSRDDEEAAIQRASLEHINLCEDVPRCARIDDDVYGECAERPDPDEPLCPGANDKVNPIACAPLEGSADLTTINAVDKVIDQCSLYGRDVPSGAEPQRYCFLSCIDPEQTNPLGGADYDFNCDPAFDPPGLTPTSLPVFLDPDRSTALVAVSVGGESDDATVGVSGLLALDVPGRCVGPLDGGQIEVCAGSMPLVSLQTTGPFELFDTRFSNVEVINPEPLRDTTATIGGTSLMALDQGVRLFAAGNIEGVGRKVSLFETDQALGATIDWDTREVTVLAVLDAQSGDTASALALAPLVGVLPSLPPTADAGPDQVVECSPDGAEVSLSAASSFDPDGADDLSRFEWTARIDGVVREQSGSEVIFRVPGGDTAFMLSVTDRIGITDVDQVVVHVEDHEPPVLAPATLSTDCLWPPDHSMHLFRLGEEVITAATDSCDPHPLVRVVSVTSSEDADGIGDGSTAPDVRFGEAAVCLRAERSGRGSGRTYEMVLEANDAAGNTSQQTVTVAVPHDQRPSWRCDSGSAAPAVADDDPRCVAGLPPPPGAAEPRVARAPHAVGEQPGPAIQQARGCAVAGPGGQERRPGPLVLLGALLTAASWVRRRSRRAS